MLFSLHDTVLGFIYTRELSGDWSGCHSWNIRTKRPHDVWKICSKFSETLWAGQWTLSNWISTIYASAELAMTERVRAVEYW